MNRFGFFVVAAACSVAPIVSAFPIATINLIAQPVVGNMASAEVVITWQEELANVENELLTAFELSVADSSTLLTNGQTDYSRFSFTPDATTLADWLLTIDFGPTDLDNTVVMDSIPFGFALTDGVYSVGTLNVDLAGLPAGEAVVVSVKDLSSLFPTSVTYDDGIIFDFAEVQFQDDATFVVPEQVIDVIAVPEPASAFAAVFGLGVLAWRRRRTA